MATEKLQSPSLYIFVDQLDTYLILVYGITERPLMLATNKEIKLKDNVIKIVKLCFFQMGNRRKFPLQKHSLKASRYGSSKQSIL